MYLFLNYTEHLTWIISYNLHDNYYVGGQQIFSVKVQIVNILDFVGQAVSPKIVIDNV